jgi:hypothetical protein
MWNPFLVAGVLCLLALFFLDHLMGRNDSLYRFMIHEVTSFYEHPYWGAAGVLGIREDGDFNHYFPSQTYMLLHFWKKDFRFFQLKPYPWKKEMRPLTLVPSNTSNNNQKE